MKLKKFMAMLMVAMMLVASFGTMASAEDVTIDFGVDGTAISAWGSNWTQSYDAALQTIDFSEYSMYFEVTGGPYDADNNVVVKAYGFNGDNNNAVSLAYEEGVTSYVLEVPMSGATADNGSTFSIELDEWNGFGFNLQAGHKDITIDKAYIAKSSSASEPTPEPVEFPTYAPFAAGTFQVDLAAFAGVESDIVSIDVVLSSDQWQADWGVGGSCGFGIDCVGVDDAKYWYQLDTDADANNANRDAASSEAWTNAMTNEEDFVYTYELPADAKTPYIVEDTDPESETYGEMISAGVAQIGVWWTAGNQTVMLNQFTVNFADGTSIDLIDAASTETYDKDAYTAAMLEIWGIELGTSDAEPTPEPTPEATPVATEDVATEDDATTEQPATGDNGIVIFAVIAVIALAGVVVAKKARA